jgi:hypothetical protein
MGAGVIERRRAGKHNFYRLTPQRCQAYLNEVFGAAQEQARKLRVDEGMSADRG